MKYSIPAAFAALSAVVIAQQPITSLPPCSQTCVNNMLGQATALGCTSGDAACLCRNSAFQDGIRDCDNEFCGAVGNPSNAQAGIAWGMAYCAAAISAPASTTVVATTTVASSSAPTIPVAVPITTSPIVSDGSTVGSSTIFSTAVGSVGSSAISTIESTLTTDGSTETTGISTIFTSVASAGGIGGVGAGGASGASTTVITSVSSSRISSSSGGVLSSASSAASSIRSSATGNSAPIQTAFPGFVAAAGLAAFLL